MLLRWIKYVFLFLIVLALGFGFYVYKEAMARLAPRPSMLDSPTSIIGFNHIGLSVKDLDSMLDFYQEATDYQVIDRYSIHNDSIINRLYGMDSLSFERAILRGPNMLLELTEYAHNHDATIAKMLPQGPGMTHTCYQSHPDRPTYDSFKEAGIDILSRGDAPIDNGLGVTYAYGYDPEGNMVELEQMSWLLISMHIGKSWAQQHGPWMTQVAVMTPDLPRLVDFYKNILQIEPYRMKPYGPHPTLDAIIDADSVTMHSAWFALDSQGKKLEMMQYTNPTTPPIHDLRHATDLGYSFSLEVSDIGAEYTRLIESGVSFISEPQQSGAFWEVICRDIDGNTFSLRQVIDGTSPLSLLNM